MPLGARIAGFTKSLGSAAAKYTLNQSIKAGEPIKLERPAVIERLVQVYLYETAPARRFPCLIRIVFLNLRCYRTRV